MSAFSDPAAISHYADTAMRLVPGLHGMHRMAALLLAERAGADADILVLGAGGGLELTAFATGEPGWRFVGVDPSAAMLALAAETLGALASRVELIEGKIDSAPAGPFDGATCLLTLHFLPRDQRLRTLTGLRNRLKSGAPLVVAHFSFPQEPDQKTLWMGRYAAFAIASGIPAEKAQSAAQAIATQLPVLSPQDDEAMLQEAGFTGVSQFYAGFTFRGWVAYAP